MKKKRDFTSTKVDSLSSLDIKDEKILKLMFLSFARQLRDQYNISPIELLKNIKDEVLLPTNIFNKKLGCLESIIKYLKENLKFSNKKISKLINRNSQSIWQAYNQAKKKHPRKFPDFHSPYKIPLNIISNTKLGILENIVLYLKDNLDLQFNEIAEVLKRDQSTIWTTYNRAKKKR